MNNEVKHPGKVLQERLNRLNMSRSELAIRTGVSEKHISTVINGSKAFPLLLQKS